MKKTYMIPTLQVVKIQPAQFIAASEKIGFGSSSYDGTLPIEARSARFSDDDDWEDWEE